MLRSQLSENWVQYIKLVVDQYNNTPLKKLGYLKPNDIVEQKDSVSVDVNKQKLGLESYKQPSFEEQIKNVEEFSKDKTQLQVGDYCYKFFDEKLFDKKYNISVSKILI